MMAAIKGKITIMMFFTIILSNFHSLVEEYRLIIQNASITSKTSTAKQVLGNCERMVLANLKRNWLSNFIL